MLSYKFLFYIYFIVHKLQKQYGHAIMKLSKLLLINASFIRVLLRDITVAADWVVFRVNLFVSYLIYQGYKLQYHNPENPE